jgi:hypothetical protein
MSSTIRTIIIVVVIAVLGWFLFSQFSKKETASGTTALGSSGLSTVNSDAIRIGNEFRITLSSIRSLTFIGLRDFTQKIDPAQPGRQNPFAPIGTAGATSRGGPSILIQ